MLSGGSLLLTDGYAISIASTATSVGSTITVSSPITLGGNYTFANNATTTDISRLGASTWAIMAGGFGTLLACGAATGFGRIVAMPQTCFAFRG